MPHRKHLKRCKCVFFKGGGLGLLIIRKLGICSRKLEGVQYRKEFKGKGFCCNNFTIKVHTIWESVRGKRSFPSDCCTRKLFFSAHF